MRNETKTVFVKKYIYNLNYKLWSYKGTFYVEIISEKFEKEKFLSGEKKAKIIEKSLCTLPKMGLERLNELFDEICENLVFPCSLSYIIEDLEETDIKKEQKTVV